MTYSYQPLAWIVKPDGDHLFAEVATTIRRDDEGAGQFLRISQAPDSPKPGEICISLEEWPAIRNAIERAFETILADELTPPKK